MVQGAGCRVQGARCRVQGARRLSGSVVRARRRALTCGMTVGTSITIFSRFRVQVGTLRHLMAQPCALGWGTHLVTPSVPRLAGGTPGGSWPTTTVRRGPREIIKNSQFGEAVYGRSLISKLIIFGTVFLLGRRSALSCGTISTGRHSALSCGMTVRTLALVSELFLVGRRGALSYGTSIRFDRK